MAKRSSITNKEALTLALSVVKESEDASPALIEKLEHMIAGMNRPKVETPEQREMREHFIPETLKAMEKAGKPVSNKYLTEHVNGACKPQKVASITRKLIAMGKIEKFYDGKAVFYKLVAE